MLEVLDVLNVMRRVLICMLEAAEGELCLLGVLEVIRCMLLRSMLDAVEGRLCSLEVGGVGGDGCDTPCAARYAGGCGG